MATEWMNWMDSRKGGSENDPDFNKYMSQFWPLVHLPEYHTIQGSTFAWCALTVNVALIKSGYKGNGRADANSFCSYGTACEPTFGCVIVLRHKDGNHHVAFFSRWIDKEHQVIELFGGNQHNMLCKAVFIVSGNSKGHDEIVASRWPVKVEEAPQPKPADSGEQFRDVRLVQARLNQLGANPQLSVDGEMGKKTETALVQFQKAHGILPDGVAGPATRAALAKGL